MKTKVVWLAPYPIRSLEPEIQIKRRPSTEHACSWIVNLSNALVERSDVELHLVTESSRVSSTQRTQKGRIAFHVVGTGIPFLNRGFPPWLPLDMLTGFRGGVAKLLKEVRAIEPDIIHAHGTEAAYALTAVRTGLPCLISMQGIITEIFKTNPCLRFRIVRHYEQDCVRQARYFACRTGFDTAFVRSVNPNAHIFTIHEAMNPVYFQHEWRVQEEDRLLYVGSLEAPKGLDILLEALRLVVQTKPKTILTVVGGGNRAPYQQLCERLRITGNVEFLGFLPAEEIAKCHLRTQVLVLPSANDNSPNTIAEAMVSGLPVIASAVGGIPSMIEHGQSGWLVPPRNPVELANAILLLLNDSKLRAQLGEAARERARTRHLPDRVAEQTVRAYREILELEACAHR